VAGKLKNMRIGTYLVREGLLTREQAQQVIDEQAGGQGPLKERFGRIAARLGFLSERDVDRAFLAKSRREHEIATGLYPPAKGPKGKRGRKAGRRGRVSGAAAGSAPRAGGR
jgi:hypothetical protein